MDLYLLRHAIAEERDSVRFPDDSLRPLTSRGIRRMEKAAKGMKSLGLHFDKIITSPYVRAAETARITARILGCPSRIQIHTGLAADAPPKVCLSWIKKMAEQPKSICLVGHEPGLSLLASFLLIGNSELGLQMKKGGLCQLRITRQGRGSQGDLVVLYPPGILRRLA